MRAGTGWKKRQDPRHPVFWAIVLRLGLRGVSSLLGGRVQCWAPGGCWWHPSSDSRPGSPLELGLHIAPCAGSPWPSYRFRRRARFRGSNAQTSKNKDTKTKTNVAAGGFVGVFSERPGEVHGQSIGARFGEHWFDCDRVWAELDRQWVHFGETRRAAYPSHLVHFRSMPSSAWRHAHRPRILARRSVCPAPALAFQLPSGRPLRQCRCRRCDNWSGPDVSAPIFGQMPERPPLRTPERALSVGRLAPRRIEAHTWRRLRL